MDYEFRPRPVPTAIAILAALAFLSLGIWQTARFFEKSGIESLQRQRGSLPVEPLHGLELLADEANDFRTVEATGTIAHSPTFMVAYRRYLGHQGCWVVNPMHFPDGSVVLVVRGFAIESAPAQCEPPPLPDAPPSWRALVNTPLPNPIDRVARAADPDDITTWQTFDIEGMYAKLDGSQRPPRDTVLILDESHDDRPAIFAGDDVVAPYLSSMQHLSYAGTWFVVLLIVAAMWGAISVRRVG